LEGVVVLLLVVVLVVVVVHGANFKDNLANWKCLGVHVQTYTIVLNGLA
jgi:hypothetical protein